MMTQVTTRSGDVYRLIHKPKVFTAGAYRAYRVRAIKEGEGIDENYFDGFKCYELWWDIPEGSEHDWTPNWEAPDNILFPSYLYTETPGVITKDDIAELLQSGFCHDLDCNRFPCPIRKYAKANIGSEGFDCRCDTLFLSEPDKAMELMGYEYATDDKDSRRFYAIENLD